MEGRVEICKNNVWGTACDNGWGVMDAKVVCGQLGYSTVGKLEHIFFSGYVIEIFVLYINITGAAYTVSSSYGPGTGPIALSLVACTGTERRLIDCTSGSLSSCTHSRDAGVRCMLHTGN